MVIAYALDFNKQILYSIIVRSNESS